MDNRKDLEEREKELDCLYTLAEILTTHADDTWPLMRECAEALKKAMSYPERTNLFLSAEGETLGSLSPHHDRHLFSAEAFAGSGEPVTISVWYDPPAEFEEREKKLVISAASLLANALTRNSYYKRLESKTKELEEKNTALREVLHQIDSEKEEFVQSAKTAADTLILPLICELQDTALTPRQKGLITQLKKQLDELTGTAAGNLGRISNLLTPRELEICSLIKSGEATKDIASLLNISPQTVERHRNTIRKKLGLNRKNINLILFLRNMY